MSPSRLQPLPLEFLPTPFHHLLVSWCCFFFNIQFDFSSFIQGKTSDVFLWKYITIMYVYLFFKSHEIENPTGQGRSICTQVQKCGTGVLLLQLGLGEGKRKTVFTEDHVKRRAFSQLFLLPLAPHPPSLCPLVSSRH